MSEYQPLTFKLSLNLSAPHTWAASILPALYGVLYCRLQGLNLGVLRGIGLIVACVLLQSSVNVINDYADFVKGTDSMEDNLEESDAVLLYGGIAPASALHLGVGLLAAGCLLGILCALGRGVVPLALGIIGAAVIGAYSCGPVPLSYLPLGEAVSGIVMGGLIPLGICSCADGHIHWMALAGSVPMIIGIALIMLSNNGSDIEKDRAAGRHTLPVLLGRSGSVKLFRVLLVLWLVLLTVLPLLLAGPIGLVSPLLIAVLGFKPFGRLFRYQLKPCDRILQMKTINAANFAGNGAYCLALLAACIAEVLHV